MTVARERRRSSPQLNSYNLIQRPADLSEEAWAIVSGIVAVIGILLGVSFTLITIQAVESGYARDSNQVIWDAAIAAVFLFGFVYFEVSYLVARLTRKKYRKPPGDRTDADALTDDIARRQEAARRQRQSQNVRIVGADQAPTPDAAQAPTPDAAQAPTPDAAQAPTPDAAQTRPTLRSVGADLTNAFQQIRRARNTITITLPDGTDRQAALAAEAAKRGWRAVVDELDGSLKLWDPKRRRAYTTEFKTLPASRRGRRRRRG